MTDVELNNLLDEQLKHMINMNMNIYNPWSSASCAAPSSHSIIQTVINKLPIILTIKNALIQNGKLRIKYDVNFDKYLPDTGTLYFQRFAIYGIFDRNDDKYWYKCLELTYDCKELSSKNIGELRHSHCILINDFDKKLDNNEIENLVNPSAYKDFAHALLEEHLLKEDTLKLYPAKSDRVKIHFELEDLLKDLHD